MSKMLLFNQRGATNYRDLNKLSEPGEPHSINVNSEAEFQQVNLTATNTTGAKTTAQNSTEILMSINHSIPITPQNVLTEENDSNAAEELDVAINVEDLAKCNKKPSLIRVND